MDFYIIMNICKPIDNREKKLIETNVLCFSFYFTVWREKFFKKNFFRIYTPIYVPHIFLNTL